MLERLFLVRHGQTLWNSENRFQGRLDSALTEQGQRQADANGRLLARHGVQRLLVSPLGRTTETAYIINSYTQAPIDFDDALVERDCGAWSGLTFQDIQQQQPLAWQARLRAPWEHRPPGGENLPDVVARIAPVVEGLLEGADGCVAIVSHGVVGKALLSHCLALAPADAAAVRQPNDVTYALTFHDGQVGCEYFRSGIGPLSGMVRSA